MGHPDSKTRFITREQGDVAETWFAAYTEDNPPGVAAYGDRLAMAACSRSDTAGRADAATVARIYRRQKAAEAAQAVDIKYGKGRAAWLAQYLAELWTPTAEGRRQERRPEKIRQELADAIKEIADFYNNYRK